MQKHKITIFLLILYYAWFAYVGWHMVNGTDNEAEGLRMITMIIISIALAGIYLVIFLFKLFATREPDKANFIFLWLITLPIIAGAVYKLIHG